MAFCLFQGIQGLYRGYKSTVLREVSNLISNIELQKNDMLCLVNLFGETGLRNYKGKLSLFKTLFSLISALTSDDWVGWVS